jgi:hypothetical protein
VLQNKEEIKDNLKVFVIIILTWGLCFFKPIISKTYTTWDTHDIGFVNFLYFSDSLRNGFLPLWNHFIQSGTFFPSFNNIGLFSPFQLIFVALSLIISPVYAFELMIQASVLIGGIGSYLSFRNYTDNKFIALFGAIAFTVTVLVPIVGQIGFVFSLSSVPWLVFICIKLNRNPSRNLNYFVLGVLSAFYLASGYLWMNLVNLGITAIFSMGLLINKYSRTGRQDRKSVVASLFNWLIYFGSVAILYACLIYPGYLSLGFNYSLFNGDYVSPEPRLRSLLATTHYTFSNIYTALVASVDPRIVINNVSWLENMRWSWGAGWVMLILFLGISTRKLLAMQLFWLSMLVVAVLYSAGDGNYIGKLISQTPILSANRWWHIGVFYTIICLVFLAIPKLIAMKERSRHMQSRVFSLSLYDLQVLLVGAFASCLLYYFRSSPSQFALVVVIVSLLLMLHRTQDTARWNILLSVLMVVNVISFALMPYDIPSRDPYLLTSAAKDYLQQIREREEDVVITNNLRTLGESDTYIYNDETWLLKKIPFTHGYNNLGNPFVWYVKNDSFLKRVVFLTQNVRQEASLERKDFSTDNEFAKAMMGDVQMSMERPTIDAGHFRELSQRPDFQWELNELHIDPNTARMRISTNAATYLVFNNIDHPGWDAYVNGRKVDLVRTNRIFQGVFLEEAGNYEVVFKFRPILTIFLIGLPYIMLIFGLLALLQCNRRREE